MMCEYCGAAYGHVSWCRVPEFTERVERRLADVNDREYERGFRAGYTSAIEDLKELLLYDKHIKD